MKKILCLIDRLGFRGGAERQMSGLVSMLYNKGYDISAVTYIPQDHPSVLELEYGLSYTCLAATSIYSKIFKVYKIIKEGGIDVVIAYKDGPTQLCCILKLLGLDFKLIVSERNTTQDLNFRERIKFMLYHYADAIVPNAFTQSAFIKKHYPELSSRVVTITNFVDTNKFKPKSYTYQDVIECIVVSSIKKQKNPLNFIKSVKILKDSGAKFHINWYGNINDQSLYIQTISLIKELNVENYIEIKPAVQTIQDEYPKYELFILPSFFEGFPNTLCEAMSCGLNVVASNVCDNPYILENGTYGAMFNPNDPKSIATAILEYVNRRDEYRALRLTNRERMLELCSEESFVNNYIKTIDDVLS